MKEINYRRTAVALLAILALAPWSIDLQILPLSLQTLIIFTAALSLRPLEISLVLGLYLLLGALGLPVYGGHTAGWEKLIGPTAGFLWGLVPVSAWLAWESQRKEMHLFNALIAGFKAHFLLLIPGFLVLYWLMPQADLWGTFVRLIPGLILKTFLIGILVSLIRKYTGQALENNA